MQAHILGGEVKGKVALMFDDMISTAGSITGAAKVLHEHGVKEIHVAATHAVLVRPGDRAAQGGQPRQPGRAPIRSRCGDDQILPQTQVLTVAPLLGEAIKRIHRNESVSRLFR